MLIAAAPTWDWNVVLNLFTIAVLIVAAVPVLRSKRKDGVIAEQEKVIASHDELIKTLERERNECRLKLAECQGELRECQGKYAEQSKYTARDALEKVETEMIAQNRAFKVAMDALGDLVQKDIEVTARLLGTLESQGVTWTRQSSSPSPED